MGFVGLLCLCLALSSTLSKGVEFEVEPHISRDKMLEVANGLNEEARRLFDAGEQLRASTVLEQVLMAHRGAIPAGDLGLLTPLRNLAITYLHTEQWQNALLLYEEALTITMDKLPEMDAERGTAHTHVGEVYFMMRDFDKAVEHFKKALKIRRKKGAPDVIRGLHNLAGAYHQKKMYNRALPRLREALELARAHLPRTHPDLANSLNNMAALYDSMGAYLKAMPLYKEAIALAREVLPQHHPGVVMSLNNLAGLFAGKQSYKNALPLYAEILQISRATLSERNPELLGSVLALADTHFHLNHTEEALPLYEEALSRLREMDDADGGADEDNTLLPTTLNNVAALYHVKGDYERAEPLYKECLDRLREQLPADHPEIATALVNLAGVYRSRGDKQKALELYTKGLTIRKKAFKADSPAVQEVDKHIQEIDLPALPYVSMDGPRAASGGQAMEEIAPF